MSSATRTWGPKGKAEALARRLQKVKNLLVVLDGALEIGLTAVLRADNEMVTVHTRRDGGPGRVGLRLRGQEKENWGEWRSVRGRMSTVPECQMYLSSLVSRNCKMAVCALAS